MKSSTVLVPLAFLSTLLLSARMPGDSVTFAPSDGAVLTKSFEVKGSLSLDDVSMSMNGEDQDPSMMGIPSDLAVDFGTELEITDVFASVVDGRPTDFIREFNSMRAWSESSDGESTDYELDDVVGKKARFVWNEEDGAYTRSFVDDEESDPEDLDMIAIDMDLRALLPTTEVEAGDTWTMSGFPVFLVLLPGIDIPAVFEGKSEEFFADGPEDMEEQIRSALEGVEATCTYVGTSDVDGTTVAVIEFVCEIDHSTNLGPDALGEEGIEDGGFEIMFDMELKGECMWDVAAGHFASFESEGLGSISALMTMSIPDMFDLEASGELSVELNHSYTATLE